MRAPLTFSCRYGIPPCGALATEEIRIPAIGAHIWRVCPEHAKEIKADFLSARLPFTPIALHGPTIH